MKTSRRRAPPKPPLIVGDRVGTCWAKGMNGERWRFGVVVWATPGSFSVRVEFDDDFPDTTRDIPRFSIYPEDEAKSRAVMMRRRS